MKTNDALRDAIASIAHLAGLHRGVLENQPVANAVLDQAVAGIAERFEWLGFDMSDRLAFAMGMQAATHIVEDLNEHDYDSDQMTAGTVLIVSRTVSGIMDRLVSDGLKMAAEAIASGDPDVLQELGLEEDPDA